MHTYFFNINTDDNGNHEIHTDGCSYLPAVQNREIIGYYSDCKEALNAAKNRYPSKSFDGCYWCCRNCHTG
jgi:hypothetical protein